MKLNLKPGVSPAYFWATLALGLGGTAASALSLTAYAWAAPLSAVLLLALGHLRDNGPKPPPPNVN